jgi:hypothetical protein
MAALIAVGFLAAVWLIVIVGSEHFNKNVV